MLTSRQDANIRLSPDTRFVYSGMGTTTLQRLSLAGGAATSITGVESTPYLAFAEDSAIWLGSYLSTGTWRHSPDGRDSLMFPRTTISQILPGSRYAIGVGLAVGINFGPAQLMDLTTGEVSTLFDTPVVEVRYTKGYLLYVRTDNAIAAVPFDAEAGRVTGAPVEIAADVSVSTIGFAQWAVAETGTVVYIPGSESDLVGVSRDGQVRVLLGTRQRYHSRGSLRWGTHRVRQRPARPRHLGLFDEDARLTRATFQRDGHDPE
jgi:hypothetical protein